MIGIKKRLTTHIVETMTNAKKIIIVATLIHLAAIVYGIIRGLWDAVILAIVLLGASLLYSLNKDKKS
jgi:predicted nucleic acid-binding protein